VGRGGAIIRVEKINAKSGNRESFGLAGPRRAGDGEHPGRHLSTEIAVCPLAHIFGKIGAHALSGFIGDTEMLQLFSRGLHALASRLQMRIGFWFRQLRCVSGGHYAFVVFLHRYLKPANVMIDDRGQAIIMDFGPAAVAVPPIDAAD